MTRTRSQQIAVDTPFGKMYIILEYDHTGKATGGWIAHPMKNETSQVTVLVEALSHGLHEAIKGLTP